jgi:hypothetical protein
MRVPAMHGFPNRTPASTETPGKTSIVRLLETLHRGESYDNARRGVVWKRNSRKEPAMCLEYEWEYMQHQAEQARRAMQKAEEELKKPRPAAPAAAPQTPQKDDELVPV